MGSTQLVNKPKRKPSITRRLIVSASQGPEHNSALCADDNVVCEPSNQSRVLDGDQPLPLIRHLQRTVGLLADIRKSVKVICVIQA